MLAAAVIAGYVLCAGDWRLPTGRPRTDEASVFVIGAQMRLDVCAAHLRHVSW